MTNTTTNQLFIFLILLSLNNMDLFAAQAAFSCPICGEGKQVSAPDAVFSFPQQPPVPCGVLESAGANGIIPEKQCPFLPALLTMCQCVPTTAPAEAFAPVVFAPVVAAPAAPVVVADPISITPLPSTPVPSTSFPTKVPTNTPTAEPTTVEPTVEPPAAPTSANPTPNPTFAPTTPNPTTPVPTTLLPTTAKLTSAPKNPNPTTAAPTTAAPTTAAPTLTPATPVPTPTPRIIMIPPIGVGDDDDENPTEESLETQEAPTFQHSVGTITLGSGDDDEDEPLPDVVLEPRGGFYCGTSVADSQTNCQKPCTTNDDCRQGEVCWGSWNICYDDADADEEDEPTTNSTKLEVPSSPLPTELQPVSDYRCGVSEVDARSNCGKLCTTNTDCDNDNTGKNIATKFCWATHANYCHVKLEQQQKIYHPYCDPTQAEQVHRRCGFDEQAARSFCGSSCETDGECSNNMERCFPVHLNLCDCFQQQDDDDEKLQSSDSGSGSTRRRQQRHLNVPITSTKDEQLNHNRGQYFSNDAPGSRIISNRKYFDAAKEPLIPYFIATNNNDKTIYDNGDGSSNTNNNNGALLLLGVSESAAASSSASNVPMLLWSAVASTTLLIVIALCC